MQGPFVFITFEYNALTYIRKIAEKAVKNKHIGRPRSYLLLLSTGVWSIGLHRCLLGE